jgi:hypothetical protein
MAITLLFSPTTTIVNRSTWQRRAKSSLTVAVFSLRSKVVEFIFLFALQAFSGQVVRSSSIEASVACDAETLERPSLSEKASQEHAVFTGTPDVAQAADLETILKERDACGVGAHLCSSTCF